MIVVQANGCNLSMTAVAAFSRRASHVGSSALYQCKKMAFHRRRFKEAEDPVGEDEMIGLGVAFVVHVDVRWAGVGYQPSVVNRIRVLGS